MNPESRLLSEGVSWAEVGEGGGGRGRGREGEGGR